MNDAAITVSTFVPELDPVAAAKLARLRYVSDELPGISRHKARHGFDYRDPAGNAVADFETLSRIKKLAVPPAWTGVWICPWPHGHLQATGRDDRGRKQYRYHVRWREVRDESKYGKLLVFARSLPLIRARIEADLRRRGLPRARVIAAVLQLMQRTFIRIGNSEYAKANGSFGLTTLRNKHVVIEGSHIRLSFRGKSGVRHETDLDDRRLARIVRDCRELPGYELFQYIDDEGGRRTVNSSDVNDYLRAITGEEITAKDFRTWAGTVSAAEALLELPVQPTASQQKQTVVRAVELVAKQLGNTRTVCRRCYIHPAILDGYLDGTLLPFLEQHRPAGEEGLRPMEAAIAAYLRERRDDAVVDAAPCRGKSRKSM